MTLKSFARVQADIEALDPELGAELKGLIAQAAMFSMETGSWNHRGESVDLRVVPLRFDPEQWTLRAERAYWDEWSRDRLAVHKQWCTPHDEENRGFDSMFLTLQDLKVYRHDLRAVYNMGHAPHVSAGKLLRSAGCPPFMLIESAKSLVDHLPGRYPSYLRSVGAGYETALEPPFRLDLVFANRKGAVEHESTRRPASLEEPPTSRATKPAEEPGWVCLLASGLDFGKCDVGLKAMTYATVNDLVTDYDTRRVLMSMSFDDERSSWNRDRKAVQFHARYAPEGVTPETHPHVMLVLTWTKPSEMCLTPGCGEGVRAVHCFPCYPYARDIRGGRAMCFTGVDPATVRDEVVVAMVKRVWGDNEKTTPLVLELMSTVDGGGAMLALGVQARADGVFSNRPGDRSLCFLRWLPEGKAWFVSMVPLWSPCEAEETLSMALHPYIPPGDACWGGVPLCTDPGHGEPRVSQDFWCSYKQTFSTR